MQIGKILMIKKYLIALYLELLSLYAETNSYKDFDLLAQFTQFTVYF